LAKPDAQSGEYKTHHRGAVLEQVHLDDDVGAGLHAGKNFLATASGFATYLPEGAGERGTFGHERNGQGHIRGDRTLVVAAGEGQQALEDREPGSGDEDGRTRQQRPEVSFLAVPELVVSVSRRSAWRSDVSRNT
jgi:hypothetical protein